MELGVNIGSDWSMVKLGEICEKAAKIKRKEAMPDETFIYLDIGGIDNQSNRIADYKTYYWKDAPSRAQQVVKVGDTLFSTVRTYLKNIAMVDKLQFEGQICSSGFTVIRAINGLADSKFLFAFSLFEGFLRPLNKLQTGTSYPAVRDKDVFGQIIPIPPLPEQRAIVSKIEQLFSDLDNGIENFKKAQEQLKHYRQSVLKNAFEGKLVPTEAELACAEGRDYEPANVLLARILKERREKWNGRGKYKEPAAPDTNGLSLLPEGWCWVRLDSLAALKGGITKDQNRKVADARKIPYLRVANVQRGYLDLSEIKKIEAKESVISELLLKPGDILFNEGGDRDKLGRGYIWNGELEECIYQNHIFRARIYSSDSSNKIISWFGNTFGQRYFMKEGKQTTNLASINLTKLSAFPVPLSPLTEQCRIVSEVERRLSLCDKMEATIAESLEKAESLRQSILKKAFEGKLLNEKELEEARNAPDWEPAEKLVERIRQEKQIKENNNKPTRRKTHG
jgi:type I restriction enzyme S subunit